MNTIIIFFSRADENYFGGAMKYVEVGNTEIVKLDDVIEYIIRSENAAERVQPQRPPECFREQLNDVWFDVPDVLTITEVSAITGYTPNAVDRWIVKGSLRLVIVQTGLITCREWLIDFYCGDGYNIVKKVDKHLELLRKLI